MMTQIGYESLFSIISHLVFIGLAWWALSALNFEKMLKANKVAQARLLYILLAVALGTAVSNFFLDYFDWSRQFPYIFD
jgi:conserved hypothetical integral membrane protein